MAEIKPGTAVSAVEQSTEQAAAVCVYNPVRSVSRCAGPAFHQLDALLESRVVDDPQILKHLRALIAESAYALVDRILDDRPDRRSAPQGCALLCQDPFVVQVLRDPVGSVAFFHEKPVDRPNHFSFILVDPMYGKVLEQYLKNGYGTRKIGEELGIKERAARFFLDQAKPIEAEYYDRLGR